MLEIIGLIVSIGGIATLARRRGTDTVLWAGLAGGGYLIVLVVGAVLFRKNFPDDGGVYSELLAWAWIGVVALFVRFCIGATKAKPGGMWNCPNCHYLNAASAIVCEACTLPYQEKRSKKP